MLLFAFYSRLRYPPQLVYSLRGIPQSQQALPCVGPIPANSPPGDRRAWSVKRFLFLSLLTLASCQKHSGYTSEGSLPKGRGILNGTVISKSEYPSVGLVKGPTWICTGTLISNDVVLTAHHCVTNENGTLATIKFTLDTPYSSSTNNWITASSIKPYKTGDLALVKLSTPILNVAPSELSVTAATNSNLYQMVDIVGYGDSQTTTSGTRKTDSGAGTKRRGQSQLVRFDDSNATLVSKPSVSNQVICPGDSGGPLFISVNGRKQLSGVASSVLWRGYCNTVSESYHGHVAYQRNRTWILQNLAEWAQRTSIFRGVNPSKNYLFSTSSTEGSPAYNYGNPPRAVFKLLNVPAQFSNCDASINLMRCRTARGTHYLSAASCGSNTFDKLLGYACNGSKNSQSPANSFDLYRLDNSLTGASISTSLAEANTLVRQDPTWRIIGFHGVHVLPP
ncbi:MAG: hypothetical protein EBQ85_07945 [Proteobacteria bacterium]|nr:hypothetical protein [Pseudomonadota bacterium]